VNELSYVFLFACKFKLITTNQLILHRAITDCDEHTRIVTGNKANYKKCHLGDLNTVKGV